MTHLLLALLIPFAATATALSPSEYRGARAVALKLKRHYDFKQTTFICLGRSPIAIAAFLEEVGAQVNFLPMSGLNEANLSNANLNAYAYVLGRFWQRRFTPEQIAYLDQHFDHFIINDVKRTTLVLIDYVGTGTTLSRARTLLQSYLARTGRTTQLKTFPLTLPTGAPIWALKNFPRGESLHVFWSVFTGLGGALTLESLKHLAPYGQYRDYQLSQRAGLGLPYLSPERKIEAYQELQNSLRAQIRQDNYLCNQFLELTRGDAL